MPEYQACDRNNCQVVNTICVPRSGNEGVSTGGVEGASSKPRSASDIKG